MRNAFVAGRSPLGTNGTIRSPHAVFPCHDGIRRGTNVTNLATSRYGHGDVGPSALSMQGTLGTALSANSGWLTLTGATDHCYAAQIDTAQEYAGLYHATGAILMWAQFNANISGNTNASPCALSFGNGHGVAGKANLRMCLDRNAARARLQYKGSNETALQNQDAASGDPFSDSVDSGMAVYVNFVTNEYAFFHGPNLNSEGTLAGAAIGSFAEAFSVDPAVDAYVIVGGAITNVVFGTSTLWEDQLRRVGAIGFAEPPANLYTLVAKLHGQNYLPAGLVI